MRCLDSAKIRSESILAGFALIARVFLRASKGRKYWVRGVQLALKKRKIWYVLQRCKLACLAAEEKKREDLCADWYIRTVCILVKILREKKSKRDTRI